MSNNFLNPSNVNDPKEGFEQYDLSEFDKDTVLEEFQELLGSISVENLRTELDEIDISTDDVFYSYQHDILCKGYISVSFDEDILRVVTYNGKCFNIFWDFISYDLITLIFKVHSPRKIMFDSIPFLKSFSSDANSLYDVKHIYKMFYEGEVDNVLDLVNQFITNKVNNVSLAMYYLIHVVKKINSVIERNYLFPLVNKEFELLKIIANAEKKGLPFDENNFMNVVDNIKKENEKCKKHFEEKYNANYYSYKSIIEGLKSKNDDMNIFNGDYFEKTKDSIRHNFYTTRLIYKDIVKNSLEYNSDRLFLKYDSCSDFMSIKANLNIRPLYDKFLVGNNDKRYIVASYYDLFYRIFAEASQVDYLIEYAKKKAFIPMLSERIFKNTDLDKVHREFYTDSFLKALIRGYYRKDNIKPFFEEELGFLIEEEEIVRIVELIFNSCQDMMFFIDKFNKTFSKDKRRTRKDNMLIYNYIKLSEVDIIKDSILRAYRRILSFNKRNKYEINIVGFVDNGFILESDEGSFNIALDIANTTLTKSYDKYLKNTPASGYIKTKAKGLKLKE